MSVARDTAFGRGGMAVAGLAAGLIACGWMRAVAPVGPLHWPWFVALCLADGATILLLTRVKMPGALRTALVLGLIATMLLACARADVFAVRGVEAASAQDAAAGAGVVWRGAGPWKRERPLHGGGARVRLEPAGAPARAWAAAIERASDGKIGGAAASPLLIDGSVDVAGGAGATNQLAVKWRVSWNYATARCGWTRATGRGEDAVIAAILDPMKQAVRRSLATGAAACP